MIVAMIITGGANEPPTAGLSVSDKTPSLLRATFATGPHTIHAETTNRSMYAKDNLFIVSSKGLTINGYDVTEVQILDKTFVTMISAKKNSVMLQTKSDGSHYDADALQSMFDEAPGIHTNVYDANAAYIQAKTGEQLFH
jgi:hypothetical protein